MTVEIGRLQSLASGPITVVRPSTLATASPSAVLMNYPLGPDASTCHNRESWISWLVVGPRPSYFARNRDSHSPCPTAAATSMETRWAVSPALLILRCWSVTHFPVEGLRPPGRRPSVAPRFRARPLSRTETIGITHARSPIQSTRVPFLKPARPDPASL